MVFRRKIRGAPPCLPAPGFSSAVTAGGVWSIDAANVFVLDETDVRSRLGCPNEREVTVVSVPFIPVRSHSAHGRVCTLTTGPEPPHNASHWNALPLCQVSAVQSVRARMRRLPVGSISSLGPCGPHARVRRSVRGHRRGVSSRCVSRSQSRTSRKSPCRSSCCSSLALCRHRSILGAVSTIRATFSHGSGENLITGAQLRWPAIRWRAIWCGQPS